MQELRAVLAALMLGAPLAAHAADITRIASSFEDDDPFDLYIDVGFERTQNRAKILREQLPVDPAEGGARRDAAELWYRGADSRLNLELSIGLYRDFELTFGLPVVFQQNERWDFVSGTNSSNSTIINNCLNPDGTVIPGCAESGMGEIPLFPVPIESYRGGIGNLRFGVAYAFFNQLKDDTKPTWIVGLDYEAPTAKLRDPSTEPATSEERAGIGDRVHKYTVYTALSRRIGLADPYFRAHYTIPVPGPGIYSNCFNPDIGMGTPGNCSQGPWNRKETGIQSPHQAGFVFGSEFNIYELAGKSQRFALDLRTIGNYVSKGRYYNELSSVLHKLLYTEDFVQVGGLVAATASASDVFKLRASGTFLYNTDRALTAEPMGIDLDESGTVDPEDNTLEVNPNFDYRTDYVSRQFRATQSTTFRVELSASFSF